MKWINSKLGLIRFRHGVDGFLLFCLVSLLSAPLFSLDTDLPQAAVDYPEKPVIQKLDVQKMTDDELILAQARALETWTQYYNKQEAWNKTDKAWKQSVMTWWSNLRDSLTKQEAAWQEETKAKDEKIASLEGKNALLTGQMKGQEPIPWITGGSGLAIGVLLTTVFALAAK